MCKCLLQRDLQTSPHPWGWPEGLGSQAIRWTDFPTPVGMARHVYFRKHCERGLPHTRGDGPEHHKCHSTKPQTSPHPWGWPELSAVSHRQRRDFPTPVGMARPLECLRELGEGLPHTRGDGPYFAALAWEQASTSPHPWGWPAVTHVSSVSNADFPTPVGMAR